MSSIDVNTQSDDLRFYYKELRKFSPELAKELRKSLLRAAAPVVQEIKQSARALPSKGAIGSERKHKGSSLGLRQSLAAATQARLVTGTRDARVEIRISSTRFAQVSGRYRSLPFHVEGIAVKGKARWRHPVFGNEDHWVTQKPTPFFVSILQSVRAGALFQKAAERALSQAINKISN